MRRSSTLLPMPWEIPVCLIPHSPSQNSSFFILIFTSLAGCTLLDVDAGKSTNRTVYTFVGSPDAVVEGAFNACKVAKELIDMRKHHGEHPRMGACDVCPFIPVQVSLLHLADYSPSRVWLWMIALRSPRSSPRRLRRSLAFLCMSLRSPSTSRYLYEYASNVSYRKTLPQIRAGEYEHLAEKIVQPEWKPDFGPAGMLLVSPLHSL